MGDNFSSFQMLTCFFGGFALLQVQLINNQAYILPDASVQAHHQARRNIFKTIGTLLQTVKNYRDI